jgi:D-amino-acid dehydrogenase
LGLSNFVIRAAVVGAGVIGLSVAYHLVKAGAQVTVIDRDPEGDKASVGNAGGIAIPEVVPASAPGVWVRALGWMVDPLGPLAIRPAQAPKLIGWLARFSRSGTPEEVERISRALTSLNSRVYDDLIPLLRDTKLIDDLHRAGSLYVYESDKGYKRDKTEWDCRRSNGIEMHELTGAQAQEMEPALSKLVQRAVFTPQWSHLSDPKGLISALRKWLTQSGAIIMRNEVRSITNNPAASPSIELNNGIRTAADYVVVAAGAWSGELAAGLGDRVLLQSERGYNSTLPNPGIVVGRQLVFAQRKFVATPLACGLRIGGAAEFAGLSSQPNYGRSRALVSLARRYLPDLRTENSTNWCGHRPATPDSLPVIGMSSSNNRICYAFGHGHLGLTQAATTGRIVCDLILKNSPEIDMSPFRIQRFSR